MNLKLSSVTFDCIHNGERKRERNREDEKRTNDQTTTIPKKKYRRNELNEEAITQSRSIEESHSGISRKYDSSNVQFK